MVPVIDMHAHWGLWRVSYRALPESSLVETLDRCGISAMILSSSKAIRWDMEQGNRELFALTALDPRLYGYVVVDPNRTEDSLAEIRRWEHHPRFRGIKYHPSYAGLTIDCPQAFPIYEYAQEMGYPVLVDAMGREECSPLRLIPVSERFPSLRIIGAHAGGSAADLGLEAARNTGSNVYFDISCAYIGAGRIENLVEAAGADRVLFGTDYNLVDPAYTLAMVEEAGLSQEDLCKICRGNAAELFHLGI